MKRIQSIRLLWLLLPFLWQSCAEDKGNYSYHDLNDLNITFEDAYSAIAREEFTITPTVNAKEFNPDNYTYEWWAYDQTDSQEPVQLGTDLNLDLVLNLQQGKYLLVLKIKDKSSDIYYQKTATLKVDTPTSLGWLVLCSDGGRVRLDMVSHIKTEDNVYYDLLKGTDLENWRDPYQLVCDPNMQEPFYLVTGSGTTRLSNNYFQWNESYMIGNEFGSGSYTGTVRFLATHKPGKILIDSSGRVYYCNTLSGDGLFGSVRSNSFYVAPAAGYNAKGSPYVPLFMMWDRNNRRFVACASEFVTLGLDNLIDIPMVEMDADGFPTVGEDVFTWPSRTDQMDFFCMENTRYDRNQDGNGMTYAILGKGQQRFLYGVILNELYAYAEPKYGYTYEKSYYMDISGCTDIASATHFAFSSLKAFMYYAVGNKVYRVNLSNTTPTAELQFQLPEGEEITCLKFYLWEQDDTENRSYDLIVGSKDSHTGEGKLRIYDGFTNEGNFQGAEPKEEYGGFADIVDVIYRENIVYQQ
ncbi:MAG: hypothetical protein LUC45_04460 [Paraprevotella sp.]|nr:hypothetical protein [Paraprevotella sp.]